MNDEPSSESGAARSGTEEEKPGAVYDYKPPPGYEECHPYERGSNKDVAIFKMTPHGATTWIAAHRSNNALHGNTSRVKLTIEEWDTTVSRHQDSAEVQRDHAETRPLDYERYNHTITVTAVGSNHLADSVDTRIFVKRI